MLLSQVLTGASTTVFAIDADAAGVKGYDVAAAATRTMHLNFRAPTSNTVALETDRVGHCHRSSRIMMHKSQQKMKELNIQAIEWKTA